MKRNKIKKKKSPRVITYVIPNKARHKVLEDIAKHYNMGLSKLTEVIVEDFINQVITDAQKIQAKGEENEQSDSTDEQV